MISGFALQLFPFICMLDFVFGRKARPTESKESLPRRSWSQSTTNAIKTMLAEKAPSIALIGGASNTERYLLCRRARSKGAGRTRLITGIALTKPVLRLDPGPRFRKPLPRRACQRAKAQLRCSRRRPLARIESKHPHASYEMEWTPHGTPQHPVQQCVRLRVLPRALLRTPGRPRRPRGLGSRQPHPQKLPVVFV